MTPINFKANFVKTAYIPHKTSDNKYEDQEVSIVELDINDKNDINSLAKTAYEWEGNALGYACYIYDDAIKYQQFPDVIAEHYYALTQQNQDYKNLDSKKILGLALYSEKDDKFNEITWLQANPRTNQSDSVDREFLNIGKEMVKHIKNISDKDIKVSSDANAIFFYEKQGFKILDQDPSILFYDINKNEENM